MGKITKQILLFIFIVTIALPQAICDVAPKISALKLGKPTNVRVTIFSPTLIRVIWSPSTSSPGYAISKYQITALSPTGPESKTIVSANGAARASLTIQPCTGYSVFVQAIDETMGVISDISIPIKIESQAETPNNPGQFEVSNVKPGVQKLTWVAPQPPIMCSYVYVIKYYKFGGKNITTARLPSSETTFMVSSLEDGTEYVYTIEVVAAFRDVGSGPGDAVTKRTMTSKPESPTELEVQVINSKELLFSWTEPQLSDGWNIGTYEIAATAASGQRYSSVVHPTASSQLSATLKVDACTTYIVTITATDSNLGIVSNALAQYDVKTPAEAPNKVEQFYVSNVKPGVQKMKWVAPQQPNKCSHVYVIEYHRLHESYAITARLPSSETSFTIFSLHDETEYVYTIEVVAESGDVSSGPGNDVTKLSMTSKPEMPVNLQAAGISATALNVSWTEPELSEGWLLAHYLVSATSVSGKKESVTVLTKRPLSNLETLISVEACTPYMVAVEAVDSKLKISSNAAIKFDVMTPASVPNNAQNLQVQNDRRGTQTISWDAPAPVISCEHVYLLQFSKAGDDANVQSIMLPSKVTSYTASGLEDSTKYSYIITVVAQPGDVTSLASPATSMATLPSNSS